MAILEEYASIARAKHQPVIEFANAGHSFMRLDDPMSVKARQQLIEAAISTIAAA